MPRSPLLPLVLLVGCTAAPEPDPAVVDTEPLDSDVPIEADGTRWTIGDEVRCADPSARALTPFRRLDPGEAWAAQPYDPESDARFVGGGVAVADLTGDGLLDLLVTSATTSFGFWVQTEALQLVDARDRLPPMPARTAGVTTVDLDDDGDLDVFVAVFQGPDVVLRNDGRGRFEDVAAELGLQGPADRRSMSSSWADIDLDGDLDGFVAGYGPLAGTDGLPPGDGSSIFVQGPDRRFVDVVPLRPEDDVLRGAHTFTGGFLDADLDGWPDLYVVDDFGWTYPSLLLRNVGGDLQRVDVGAELARESMGLGVGDLNGDERPDFLVTAWDDVGLFVSDAVGGWVETSRAVGLVPPIASGSDVAWGAELVDVDDDGDLDAPIAFGHLPVRSSHPNPLGQPDALFLQDDDRRFTDVAPAWGLDDPGRHRAVLAVDLNRDGYLDLIRTDLRGPPKIDLGVCGDAAWLRIDVRQPAPNRYGIGTRVRVGLGDRVLVRELRAGGSSFGSSAPPEAHVGLGDVEVVDFVEVVWPDGTRSRLDDVPTRRGVRVERDRTGSAGG